MPRSFCDGCGKEFVSRNAVFRHLKETNGACLDPNNTNGDIRRSLFQNNNQNKVLILYGYLCLPPPLKQQQHQQQVTEEGFVTIQDGQEAAIKLLQVLEEMYSCDNNDKDEASPSRSTTFKINRSYGNTGRNVESLQQDPFTSCITEVIATRLVPPATITTTTATTTTTTTAIIAKEGDNKDTTEFSCWEDKVNILLHKKRYPIKVFGRIDMPDNNFNAEMDVRHRRVEYLLPADFLLPSASSSSASSEEEEEGKEQKRNAAAGSNISLIAVKDFFDSLPSFTQGNCENNNNNNNNNKGWSDDTKTYLFKLKKIMKSLTTKIIDTKGCGNSSNDDDEKQQQAAFLPTMKKDDNNRRSNYNRPPLPTLTREGNVQQQQQIKYKEEEVELEKQGTTIIPDNEKGYIETNTDRTNGDGGETSTNSQNLGRDISSGNNKHNTNTNSSSSSSRNGKRVLRRRRFHNFTKSVMAHDYFAFRRMDRLYHRATLRFPTNQLCQQQVAEEAAAVPPAAANDESILDRDRPFLVISVSGDLFLRGQVCRVIGVLIALARGSIDDDFVDCVFDEDYPHLVPTPLAPTFAMYAGEANYTQWEGKVKKILTARECNSTPKYKDGWHTRSTLQKVNEWQTIVRQEVAKVWLSSGVDRDSGRLVAERDWTQTVLEPWLVQAKRKLEEYRQWKNSKPLLDVDAVDNPPPPSTPLPRLSSIDQSVPVLYQTVLKCLRDVDASGLWPSTTPKRQMVMISTPAADNGDKADQARKNPSMSSLSMAHWVARNNKKLERSSAYAFQEGEGGASGSFSVGAMPGERCVQPKANQLFPDLMKAAFELERALCPDREPSSTIAINRNAQFRPRNSTAVDHCRH